MMCKIICYSKYLSHAQKQSEKKYDKLEIAFLTQNAEAVIDLFSLDTPFCIVWRHEI